MQVRNARRCLLAVVLVLLATASAGAAPRVSFELVTLPGFPIAGAQRWIELFQQLDQTSVRIRSGQGNEDTALENRGSESSPNYHVLGILTDRDQLLLPGGKKITLHDRSELSAWITTLQQEGIQGLTATRIAFGLTSKQLVAFHERVAKPISFDTKQVRSGDVVRQIVQNLGLPFQVTTAARKAFARNEPVLDDLNGLSSGTALAAALRPLGLVLAPQKKGNGEVQLLIADVRETDESWPIGWPPQASPFKTAPELFEYLNVEIADTALNDALAAIQPRVKLPFLFDYNGLARLRLDLDAVKVSFPRKRTFYKKILDTIFFQAKLTSELRVDDAGTPFLWISSTRTASN